MNHILSILAIALLLSCSGKKEEDPLTINPTAPTAGEYNADGVINWASPTSFSVNTYYTQIDTTSSPTGLNVPISATAVEGDSVRITWTVDGQAVAGAMQAKQWNQTDQKWLYGSLLTVPTNPYKASKSVKATVYFQKANKTVVRDMAVVLSQIRKTSDVLGVNFGMTKEQVKQAEYERLSTQDDPIYGWYELSPTLAGIRKSNNLRETYYTFEEGKLKSVSESTGSSSFSDRLQELATKYKLPEQIIFFPSGNLAKDYVWNNGKIRFTISQRTFDLLGKKASITYEKL